MDQSLKALNIFCKIALFCQLFIGVYFGYKGSYVISIAAVASSLFSFWSIGVLKIKIENARRDKQNALRVESITEADLKAALSRAAFARAKARERQRMKNEEEKES